ncbi:unnamed protein product [Rotaria socialis]|uniref:Uncharacterized protein n=2 Tax=Rotaria socialis TaxID=392032 RepID=A0A820FPK5_9BILA|nr:unnamed protein product [Rotaria socialis]
MISGRLSKKLVPRIHDLRQLSSVCIYCWDTKACKRWAKEYSKIKRVHNQLDSLILQIKADQKDRGKVKEPMSINIYNAGSNADKSTTELNGNFIHSLLLIDVLIRLPSNKTDQQKLVEFCKDEYADNEPQLEIIRGFERSYQSRKALWWYTRNTFVYKMLNKALRIQNTELLLLFRFVIRDIRQLLEKNQCQEPIKVYRYQTISTQELVNLEKSIACMKNDTDKIWNIKMELAGDDDNDSESLFNRLKKDYGGGEKEVGRRSLGDELQFMGENDEAEKIYSGLRECYSSDDTAFSNLCFSLGMVYKDRKRYDHWLALFVWKYFF